MPVDSMNKALKDVAQSWKTVEDCVSGSRAVKDAGEKYLPKTTPQKKGVDSYNDYLGRALFVPVTRRTKLAFQGLVFRQDPDVNGVDDALTADATLTGQDFDSFARAVFGKVLSPGRCGIMVDAAPESAFVPGASRPYLRCYPGATILDWREESVGDIAEDRFGELVGRGEFSSMGLGEGSVITTHVRLEEEVEQSKQNDPFETETIRQVRVIELGVVDNQIAQVHQLWREKRDKDGNVREKEWEPFGEPVAPKRRGVVIPFVPFYCLNQEWLGFDVGEPQLLGVAEINLSHYRNYADLENVRWKMGHPTPWASGIEAANEIIIGSGMWILPAQGAKVGVLQVSDEFSGLERALQEKDEAMAAEGARLLARPAGAPERTATEAMIDAAAERSVIATMADTTSQGLTESMAVLQWWASGAGDLKAVRERVKVKLNTDFEAAKMSPDDALKWSQIHIMGQLSKTALRYQMRLGEVYPPGWTDEDEDAELAAAAPTSPEREDQDDAEADDEEVPMDDEETEEEVA